MRNAQHAKPLPKNEWTTRETLADKRNQFRFQPQRGDRITKHQHNAAAVMQQARVETACLTSRHPFRVPLRPSPASERRNRRKRRRMSPTCPFLLNIVMCSIVRSATVVQNYKICTTDLQSDEKNLQRYEIKYTFAA